MSIRDRLKQLRTSKGLTQAQVASLFGVDSSATISHYESGLRGITIETLVTYADVFEMTVQELIAPVTFGERVRMDEPLPFDA